MRILLTGASSFSGAWFLRELVAAGHEVVAVLGSKPDAYPDALRRKRTAWAVQGCETVIGPRFGDAAFLDLLKSRPFDLLAHHGAMVTNYKSPDFDTAAALAENTRALPAVIKAFKEKGGTRVLLTGSVFEGGEGAGSRGLPDFSPYGLSKALTSRMFEYYCQRDGVSFGKFVIPNPFGEWEEPRYTAYVMKQWLKGETAVCGFPLNVRDNIHVSLLAKAYVHFAHALPESPGFVRYNPSGYPESQGAFTLRLAEAMRPRLGMACAVELKRQTEFPEPMVRINTDVVVGSALGWDEAAAWDGMARYYRDGIAG